ncbi:uroporphyrinogen decarboxylase isoform X1 [Topomyia yanbarensis]|uniref:uroporphyrinogen decarboxylase isoform X1 n=1 Tax=Topomyia yanbarensis TaxID=2498891 RepID=UPI00273AFB47|nr:uroporphyrinogen decarboxylase isoform X1 [Topomyia yanbarensis]
MLLVLDRFSIVLGMFCTLLFLSLFLFFCTSSMSSLAVADKNPLTSLPNNSEFPPLKNDNLLRAARGEPVDRVPVWVMRQAGRYLPEFLEVRAKHEFFEICRTPELACEVTMQPLRRFDLDASIIFSDILVIPQALGITVEMKKGVGPVLPEPLVTPADLERLNQTGTIERLKYVGDAITMMRHLLDGKVPLIGFSGAPWTLMGYMIEGGGSKTMSKAKSWLTDYPEASKQLLNILTDQVIDYLLMQIKAGAQMLQVFESSAEYLSKEQYLTVCLPYLKRIRDDLHKKLADEGITPVPLTLFSKGAMHSLPEQAATGYDVIGLDWTIDPVEARELVGPNVTLQGNLDPQDLYKSPEELRELVLTMVRKFGKHRYIANLGHGITPQTPVESMTVLVKAVHDAL